MGHSVWSTSRGENWVLGLLRYIINKFDASGSRKLSFSFLLQAQDIHGADVVIICCANVKNVFSCYLLSSVSRENLLTMRPRGVKSKNDTGAAMTVVNNER